MRKSPSSAGHPPRLRIVVATLATMAVAANGCSSPADPPEPSDKRTARRLPPIPPISEQPVRDPGPGDHFRLGSPQDPPPRPVTPDRPNLLMITVDDATRADLDEMPLTREAISDKGIQLDNGIAPTPICVPARASLITGQYAHNHGALTISGEGGGYDAFAAAGDDDTLPVWLNDAGYDTMFVGKYLNGYGREEADVVPPGWTDWHATVDPTTYNYTRPEISHNGELQRHQQYSTDLLRDISVDLISDDDRAERPWYMWVNYVAPHIGGPQDADDPPDFGTPHPAPQDRDAFADEDLPAKPNMFEDTSDKYVNGGTQQTWSDERKGDLRASHQQRLESLQSVDRAVAETVRTLAETGQLDNTYIVFTSDNGHALGEHNLAGKLWYFQEMLGVPMAIRGPGLPEGVRSTTPVTNADWAPTFAALAGATPSRPVDGVDVRPWLTADGVRRVIPIEAYPVKGGTRPLYTGVVVGDWTFVKGRRKEPEMYNRALDPYENSNLARDPRFENDRAALDRLRRKFERCAGDTCPTEFYRQAK